MITEYNDVITNNGVIKKVKRYGEGAGRKEIIVRFMRSTLLSGYSNE